MSATSNLLDADDPPVLGANPLVGHTRTQLAAALGRLARRAAADPALVIASALRARGDLIDVELGRVDVQPAKGDKRFTHPAWEQNPAYRRLNPVALGLLATPLRYYSPALFRRTARLLYGPVDADDASLRYQANARRARPPSLWGFASQLAAAAGWTSLPWLHRIRTPALVLAGDADPIVPPVNARILAARLPEAELEIVPGAGHLLLKERPAEVAARISGFLGTGAPDRSRDGKARVSREIG